MSVQIELSLHPITCCCCGITFGVPLYWNDERRQDHKNFYCPNGHAQVYNTNPKDREIAELKQKLANEEARKRWAESDRDRACTERDKLQKSLVATKGVLTRTKRRVGKGTCPCCGLGILDLRRHMQEQHPGYQDAPRKK